MNYWTDETALRQHEIYLMNWSQIRHEEEISVVLLRPITNKLLTFWTNLSFYFPTLVTCCIIGLRTTTTATPRTTPSQIYRGYYTVARRYEFYVRVARTISHEWASLTREILFLPREHKIHTFAPTCNVLSIIWRNQFNKSKRWESWLHWTIRHSQRRHTENTPLGSRMKWRMESTSGLVPSKTLFSI